MIAVMKAHSDSFGGVTLAVDAWKNIKMKGLLMKGNERKKLRKMRMTKKRKKMKDKVKRMRVIQV